MMRDSVSLSDCIACITALSVVLAWTPAVDTREHRQRFERRDIAVLAALTRVDHSTIFFHGYTQSGYVRDGVVQTIDLEDSRLRRGRPRDCVSADAVAFFSALPPQPFDCMLEAKEKDRALLKLRADLQRRGIVEADVPSFKGAQTAALRGA